MSSASQKIIPSPGSRPDYKSDARRVADVLLSGGLAIVPLHQGYALFACDLSAFDRLFAGTFRAKDYPVGIIGTPALSSEIHKLPEQEREMVRVWADELDQPLGVFAPWRSEHALLQKLGGDEALQGHHREGWLGMLVGGSPFQREVVRLVLEGGRLVLGSTTSLVTGKEQKFSIEDVDEEAVRAADVVVDYGLRLSHASDIQHIHFGRDGQPEVVRHGTNYEVFRDYMRRYWKVEMPAEPSESR